MTNQNKAFEAEMVHHHGEICNVTLDAVSTIGRRTRQAMPAQVIPDDPMVLDQTLHKPIPRVQILAVAMHENKWEPSLLTLVSEMDCFPVW